MTGDSKILRRSLKSFGLSDPAINAAWPDWWSAEAEGSPSAQNELRFSLARKLGLDPRSLLDDSEPRFIWRDEAKFKRLTGENQFELAALTSFGMSVGSALVHATPSVAMPNLAVPADFRAMILETKDYQSRYVDLNDLLYICWGIGIPVIHLKVFPLEAKRMCAMTVKIGARYAILLGHEVRYPAQAAYYMAHELGHIALGHLNDDTIALVDLDDVLRRKGGADDEEERAADQYALTLLTGQPDPKVLTDTKNYLARELAAVALQNAGALEVEPGTLALCFGHNTGRWTKVFAALRQIYRLPQPLWRIINTVAQSQMAVDAIPGDYGAYLAHVMGLTEK